MKFSIEIIGLVAAILTTSAFIPQVYRTWKTKDVSALSLSTLLLFFVGIILWFIYGFYIKSLSIILANGITILSYAFLILFKVKYAKKNTLTDKIS